MHYTDQLSKTIGRDSGCDLVLEHPVVSRSHARIELATDGLVSVHDTGSVNGVFLCRNDTWIRVRKVTLCIGDRIRFGTFEVPLERLTAAFGNQSNARLEATHFAPVHGNTGAGSLADLKGPGPLLRKPRRNPLTGKIEEERRN